MRSQNELIIIKQCIRNLLDKVKTNITLFSKPTLKQRKNKSDSTIPNFPLQIQPKPSASYMVLANIQADSTQLQTISLKRISKFFL